MRPALRLAITTARWERRRRARLAFLAPTLGFGLALALEILAVSALVGLDVLELSFLVADGIKLRSL